MEQENHHPILDGDMPIGLGMAMLQNPESLKRFTDMPELEQHEVIAGARDVASREEMQRYVERFSHNIQTH